MPREFVLPELAESVVEGEVVKWLVEEGDFVELNQPVVEVMTDKVTVELPSPYRGVLQKKLVAEGEVVPVHRPLALFADAEDAAGEAAGDRAAGSSADASAAAPTAAAGSSPANLQADEERSIVEPGRAAPEDDGERLSLFRPSGAVDEGPVFEVRRPTSAGGAAGGAGGGAAAAVAERRATGPYGRVLAVPAARRLARELGIDLSKVEGSGPNGRIRVEDVRRHAASAQAPAVAARQPTRYQSPSGYQDREERLPLRGLRRVISNQMLASHLQTVRTLHVDEADVTALVALRARLKPLAEKRGVKLSYLPFIMKAVVAALQAYPSLNASLDEAAGEIVRKHYYNLGMAVATDAGLVVPVIKDVDELSLLELAAEVQRLAAAARDGKLTPDEVRGGTFSITNIGSLGGLFSFPIINVPEAAILGVHSIKKRPVVLDDDRIVARQMLYLSLSFDHRLIDGAEAAMFTSRLIELLELPESLMLDL